MTRASVAAAIAVPAVIATVGLVLLMLGARAGVEALGTRPRNVAEAAATGDAAEVLRMIQTGEDPTHVYPVRDWVISSSVPYATGLEAAMWSRTLPMIRLLDDRGFIGDPQTRHHLACLAQDLVIPDIAAYLSKGDAASCRHGEAYAQVLARASAPRANP
jgi:hypothetical protein